MARTYHVDIVDEDGNLILQFKGTVIKKEQSSGRIEGPVIETLYVKNENRKQFIVTEKFQERARVKKHER